MQFINIFVLLFVYGNYATVANTFPCDELSRDECRYNPWCYYSTSTSQCLQDNCLQPTTENGNCGSGCRVANAVKYINEGTCDEETEDVYYCVNVDHYGLTGCEYLTASQQNCNVFGDQCKVKNVKDIPVCLSNPDLECNDYGVEDCHMFPFCYISEGKCIHDSCVDISNNGAVQVDENNHCLVLDKNNNLVASDCDAHTYYRFMNSGSSGGGYYETAQRCTNKENNTNPDPCFGLPTYDHDAPDTSNCRTVSECGETFEDCDKPLVSNACHPGLDGSSICKLTQTSTDAYCSDGRKYSERSAAAAVRTPWLGALLVMSIVITALRY